MTDSPGEALEGVHLPVPTVADSAILRGVVLVSVLAWGGESFRDAVKQRFGRLKEEILALDLRHKAIFVASSAAGVVGFARIARDEQDESQWWCMGIAVHPEYQRRGIGSALHHACVAYARDRGATVIRSATHVRNEASIRFHESVGFNNEGRFTAPDGDEKVGFSLALA